MRRFPPLTVAEITSRLNVDLLTGICIWRDATKHHRQLNNTIAGFSRPNQSGKNYWLIKINGRPYRRSQLILTVATGLWPENMVDHIDGDSLNDKAENLRHATVTQNAWNHKKRAKKSDCPMGVRKTPQGKYQARIAVNKKQIALGVFCTSKEASDAYQLARKEYFHAFS
jgi:hypothetical protein